MALRASDKNAVHRPLKAALVVLLLTLALVAAAGARAEDGEGEAPVVAPQVIRAQLVPRNYTTLASEIAARIDRISHRPGEHFSKGDSLVVFDCVAQRAQTAKASAVLLVAEKTYAVNRRLYEMKSLSGLELDVSAAEIEKAKADVAIAEAAQSKCTIAAPFSGVVVDEKARPFQYTTPGQPLLDILDDVAAQKLWHHFAAALAPAKSAESGAWERKPCRRMEPSFLATSTGSCGS